MRLKMVGVAVSALCIIAVSAFAADITGTWVAEMAAPKGGPGGGPGGGGPMKFTFNLKAEDSSLSGTVVGPTGNENEIIEGKIDGDKVSFAVKVVNPMGNEMKINYKGTASGDEMKLTFSMEGGMGGPGGGGMPPIEMVAKRQK